MNAILNNFDELRELWYWSLHGDIISPWSLQNLSDTEMKSRIRGVYRWKGFCMFVCVLLEKKF